MRLATITIGVLLALGCGAENQDGTHAEDKADGSLFILLTDDDRGFTSDCVEGKVDTLSPHKCQKGYYPAQCEETLSCKMVAEIDILNTEDFRDFVEQKERARGFAPVGTCYQYNIASFDLDQYNYPIDIDTCKTASGWEILGGNTVNSKSLAPDQGYRWSLELAQDLAEGVSELDVQIKIHWK